MKRILISGLLLFTCLSCQVRDLVMDTTPHPTGEQYTPTEGSFPTRTPGPTFTPTDLGEILLLDERDVVILGSPSESSRVLVYPSAGSTTTISLPGQCRIFNSGHSAICQGRSLYLLDLASGKRTDLGISNPAFWDWTPGQDLIFYGHVGSTEYGVELFSLSLANMTTHALATINYQEWLVFPELSSDGQYLVGVRRAEDNPLGALFEITDDGYEQINTGSPWYVTDLAWSPTGQVLGFGATDIIFQDVPASTIRYFMTLDMTTGVIRQISEAPDGWFYDYFFGYFQNLWSPDGSMVALVARSGATGPVSSLCIVRVEQAQQKCYPFIDPDQVLDFWTWTPDSSHIVYITGGARTTLHILSTEDETHSVIVSDINIPPTYVDELIWVSP